LEEADDPQLATPPAIDLSRGHPPRLIVVDKPSSQVDLRLSCLLERGSGKARLAEETLSALLGVVAHSELRDETGIAYGVGSQFSALAAGVDEITLSTSVDIGHVGQALSFLQRLSQLRAREISDQTLAWRRFWGLQATAFEDETTAATAESLYQAWLESRPATDLDSRQELLASLTREDLAAALTSCNDHAVIAAVGNRAAILAVSHP